MSDKQSPILPPRRRLAPFLRFSLVLHGACFAALTVAPQRWRTAAAALAANHLALTFAGTWPRSTLLGPNLSQLPSKELREVALTFDDGPDPQVTPKVLRHLASRGVRASFFAIGQRAERYPELTQAIIDHGHFLENHTYHHYNSFSLRSLKTVRQEIDRAQDVLAQLSGRSPRYFRAPAGIRNPFLEGLLQPRKLLLTSWTRRGFDTVERRPERVVQRLTQGLRSGDILLFHDGNSARTHHGNPVVLEALPRVLDELEKRGLKGVPLPA